MNRVANIFELLSDENDEGGSRRPTSVANIDTGAKKPEQKQQKPSGNAQVKNQQQAKSDRTGETKGRENRPPKSNERKEDRERRPRQERGEGAPQQQQGQPGQVSDVRKPRENNVNRPPRQQREGAERRTKNYERAPEGGNFVEGGERKRVYDRKSGAGRGIRDNTKRAGGGRGNWGTVEDDKKGQLESTETAEVKEEATPEATENKVEGEKTEVVEPVVAQLSQEDEEDAKLKTLAEYMQSRKAPTIALPPPRQVESKPEWDKYVPLTRASDEEQQPKDKKKDEKEVDVDSDAQKKTVSADKFFNFADSSPRDRDRGERGGFRGGRGGRGRDSGPRRGGDRDRGSKKPKAQTPNFKDEKSFPSLGNKA